MYASLQLIEHLLHFTFSVRIARAASTGNSLLQQLARLVITAFAKKRLRSHLIAGCVFRMLLQQLGKLLQRCLGLAGIGILQRQPVTRKRVVRVFGKQLLQRFETVRHADILATAPHASMHKQRRPGVDRTFSEANFSTIRVATFASGLRTAETYCCGRRRRDELVVAGCKLIS